MARRNRLDVPGIPQHVIQRGVNRAACFHDDVDRHFYLKVLKQAAADQDCHIHSYVLMTNHVHLLITAAAAGGLSLLMQSLGRRYVRRFNDRHERTGTLWEGRFRSCLVDTDRYLLACYRYIEMNPVRAGMVEKPTAHIWSSVHANLGLADDPLVTPHSAYTALGTCNAKRHDAYRRLLSEEIGQAHLAAIRSYTRQGAALGSSQFQRRVKELTGHQSSFRESGRPRLPD